MICNRGVTFIASVLLTYRIRKNIGEEVNLANWRTKIKSPIFYLANVFCTCLIRNLARDASAVAVIQVEQSLKNTWRPCFQLLILSNSEHVFIIIVTMAAEIRQTRSTPKQRTIDFVSAKH